MKEKFIKTNDICMGDINEKDSLSRATYLPELNILRTNEYIFERENFDAVIDCNTGLYKANSVEEAWIKALPYVWDYLGFWIVDNDYWNDYGEDIDGYIEEFHLLRDYEV